MPTLIVTTRSGEVIEMFRLDGPLPSLETLMKDLGPALRLADEQDRGRGLHGLGVCIRWTAIKDTQRRRAQLEQLKTRSRRAS